MLGAKIGEGAGRGGEHQGPASRLRLGIGRGLLLALGSLPPAVAVAQQRPVAFVGVNIIPMDRERVLGDQTVLVREGRIEAVGARGHVTLPSDATVIEAAGRFLLPGLADMHAHFFRSRDDLELFIANGVTTVRIMWGWFGYLRWRDSIAAGQLLGPSLVVAGPIIEGTPPPEFAEVIDTVGRAIVDTRAQALLQVAWQHSLGYDFLKVYNNVNLEAYTALVAEAKSREMPVAGHVPFAVGLRGALQAGQRSIEHLRGYVWEVVPPDAPQQPGADLRSRSLAWRYADTSRFRALAAATRDAGVWNVPTLGIRLTTAPLDQRRRYLARPEAVFLTPRNRATLTDSLRPVWLRNFTEDDFRLAEEGWAKQDALVRALHAAGAKLLAGTDIAPNGLSLHRELELLAAAGLSPFETLVTATRNAAQFLSREDEGTIKVGNRADLVLLRSNPLENVTNTRAIDGVMVRGRWLARDDLDRILARLSRPPRSTP